MTTGKVTELMLRTIVCTMICGILGYMLISLAIWVLALIQIGAWIFLVLAEGWPGG